MPSSSFLLLPSPPPPASSIPDPYHDGIEVWLASSSKDISPAAATQALDSPSPSNPHTNPPTTINRDGQAYKEADRRAYREEETFANPTCSPFTRSSIILPSTPAGYSCVGETNRRRHKAYTSAQDKQMNRRSKRHIGRQIAPFRCPADLPPSEGKSLTVVP